MPWPKGKPHSQETKDKISRSEKGTRIGPSNPGWKGGKFTNEDGYILIRQPNHPNAMLNGYVREHRLVMEAIIGRYLRDDEIVHHKNENKKDNRPENLELLSPSEHQNAHFSGRTLSELSRGKISAANSRHYRTAEGREQQRLRALEQGKLRRALVRARQSSAT
jgi:hypothetical protein